MKITKDHIQEIYNRLEKMYLRENEVGGEIHHYFISGIDLFRMELELILMAKSEEELKKSEEFANISMEIFNNDKLSPDEKVEKIMTIARMEKYKNSRSFTNE
jgi:hypothetical protein